MDKNKGYPLPSGDAYTEDMACAIVFYPDKQEYRRALGGSLAYLATWIAWEKESEHKGIDAALAWKNAYDLTMECWTMACFEQLQSDVAAILAIMKQPQSCCDEGDITDGDQYTDRVEDGVGDVPQNVIDAGYAEDAADWDGFDDYKCMIVHVTVSQIEAKLNEIAPLISTTGGILGGVAALAGILAVIFSTAGLAIVFGIIAGVGATSLLYQALTDFDLIQDLRDKVIDNHDELACAMYAADGDEGALVALNDKIDELFTVPEALILKNMNNGPTLKALYSGRYDQQNIAAELETAGYDVDDFDCTCIEQIGEYLFTTNWDDSGDWEGWTHDTGDSLSTGNPDYGAKLRYAGPPGFAMLDNGNLRIFFGLPHDPDRIYEIHRITVNWKADAGHTAQGKIGLRTNQTGAPWVWQYFDNVKVWTDISSEWLVTPRTMTAGGQFRLEAPGGVGNYTHWDNIRIDFDMYVP